MVLHVSKLQIFFSKTFFRKLYTHFIKYTQSLCKQRRASPATCERDMSGQRVHNSTRDKTSRTSPSWANAALVLHVSKLPRHSQAQPVPSVNVHCAIRLDKVLKIIHSFISSKHCWLLLRGARNTKGFIKTLLLTFSSSKKKK